MDSRTAGLSEKWAYLCPLDFVFPMAIWDQRNLAPEKRPQ